MMQRHPRRAACRVQQRIEQRPVGHRVRAILHAFGFAVRRGDRAGIQMVASNHNRRFQFTVFHHFIERQTGDVAFTQTEPANARR